MGKVKGGTVFDCNEPGDTITSECNYTKDTITVWCATREVTCNVGGFTIIKKCGDDEADAIFLCGPTVKYTNKPIH